MSQQLYEQVNRQLKKYHSGTKENVGNISNKAGKYSFNVVNKNLVKKSNIENSDSTKVSKNNSASRMSTRKSASRNRSCNSTRHIVGSHGDSRNIYKKQNDLDQLNMLRNITRCPYTEEPFINRAMTQNHKKWHEILQDENMNKENKNRVNAVVIDFPEKIILPGQVKNVDRKPNFELNSCTSPHIVTVCDKGSHIKVQSSKPPNSEESSPLSTSDHATSNTSNSYYRHTLRIADKSVQCNLKSATNLMSLSKSDCVNSTDGSFAMFDPVRSLHFLIRELRGMLSKSHDSESVYRVMANMEDVIQSFNINDNKFCNNSNACVEQKNSLESVSHKSSVILKSNSPPVKLSSTYHHNKILEPVKDTKSMSVQSMEIIRGDKELKKAEKLLIHNLKQDIEKLKEEIDCKEKVISDALSREKDLKKCMSQMQSEMDIIKKKYEEQAESLAKMAPVYVKLSDENKVIPKLQDSLSKANNKIEDLVQEKKDLDIKVQLYKQENEHCQTIIAWKDATLEKVKNDMKCVVDMLLQHQSYLLRKSGCDSAVRQVDGLIQYVRSLSEVDVVDKVNNPSYMKYVIPCPTSKKLGKSKSMHTSSPVSSISSTPDVSHSWDISRISDDNYCEKTVESEVVILDNNADAFHETAIEKSDNFNTSDFCSLQNETVISANAKDITHDKSFDINISHYRNQDRLLKDNNKLDKIEKSKNLDNALDILKCKPLKISTQLKLNSNDSQVVRIETMKTDLSDMINGIENIGKQGLDMFKNNLKIPDNIQVIMPPTGMSQISTDSSEADEDLYRQTLS